ncbi:MAG: DoxX family membrane protein [Patescibacteria group bacterium]
MSNELLFLIGRVLFGGYFLMNAINHFSQADMLSGYAASQGVKSPKLAVFVSGLLLLAGGAGILLGVYVSWAVLALVLFLVPVSFKMHAFWKVSEPNMKMMEMVNFTKNMALLGAALMLLAISTPWPLSF